MPISTLLPAPDLVFEQQAFYPVGNVSTAINASANVASIWTPRDLGADFSVFQAANLAGGDNVGPVFEQRGGRLMAFTRNTVSSFAKAWALPTWNPLFNPALGNGGALLDPTSVCLTLDFWLYYQSGAFTYANADATGMWFQPRFNLQPNMFAGTPNGGTPNAGFGVAVNDDGGGNGVFEFVSYSNAGAILQRTSLAALAPVLTVTNQFRWIIATATPGGGNATISLEVNGSPVAAVTELEIDDVTVIRPTTANAGALGYIFGTVFNASGGPGYWQKWHAYLGRFTPSGRELQPV